MVVTLERVQDAYRLAAELRRVGGDFLIDMRIEAGEEDGARVLLPARLAYEWGVRDIVSRYGGRFEQ
jgi:hypothetical protein